MSLSNKFAIVGGKSMTICDEQDIFKMKSTITDDDQLAIEEEKDGVVTILPVRVNAPKDVPGFHISSKSPVGFITEPRNKEEREVYNISKDDIVDFSNANTMQSVLDRKAKLDSSLNKYLETDINGNVFTPPILPDDSPEMRGLKQCILGKKIDIDKYQERFGPNYSNDKRKLKDTSITMFLLKRMCENLDLEVDMVFRDSGKDVPNPMGKEIKVNLVPGTLDSIDIKESEVEKDDDFDDDAEE